VNAVVVALLRLARSHESECGWIETGAVADALGCGVAEAAARLRSASKAGLCVSRRSLVYGTSWKATSVASEATGSDL
jgi:hypothetical protein